MAYNLQKLLDEIIEEYGINKGYKKPNVCWSEFNRLCTYGEYQYWLNKIEISKFLDNDLVGKDTLKSVIYHEYLHQMHEKHDSSFKKKENIFPNVRGHRKILHDFFESIETLPEAKVELKLNLNNETLFCVLQDASMQEYLLSTYTCNFKHYIDFGKINLNLKNLNKNKYNVIWLVKELNDYFVVGWSLDTRFFKERKTISLNPICDDIFSFQAVTEIENTSWLMEFGCNIPCDLFPKDFENLCNSNDITEFNTNDVFDYINTFDCDLHKIGFSKTALSCCAPLTETDYMRLVKLSHKSKYSMRSIWIANLAIHYKDCFETRLCLANSLLDQLLFDSAIKEYEKALSYEDNEEAKKGLAVAYLLAEKLSIN